MSAYARSQSTDGPTIVALPFAPVADLEGLRRDVAVEAAIAAAYEHYDEAHRAGRFHGELLSATVWRAHSEDEAAAGRLRVVPPVCGAWNDSHDCHLPEDHTGDHRCAGCGDVWNRGPWDEDAEDFAWQRGDERCVSS